MARSKWLLLIVVLAAPPASAEIFKCLEKNGIERYQNFPCALDTLGLPSATTTPAPGGVSQARPPAPAIPVAAPSTGALANASEPRIGMTEAEVTAIWGEPEERMEDELREGRIETWRYAYGRSVQFSNKHRVLAVQR
jgi:hypothetical protein